MRSGYRRQAATAYAGRAPTRPMPVARETRSYEADACRAPRALGVWDALLAGFECVGIQVVAGEKFVEVCAIAFRKARRLAHIAHCYLQNL